MSTRGSEPEPARTPYPGRIDHCDRMGGHSWIRTSDSWFVRPVSALVLQRHSVEWVAASFVVAEACLVLAASSPVRPGPGVFGGGGGPVDQVDQQAADFR